MIRDMRRNGSQPKDTMHKADVVMVTGMGVVIKDSTTVALPGAETASNIYVVTKERVPSGINAAKAEMSDYDDDFVKIAKGEFVGLERYTDGEKFATDQFKAADFADDVETGFAVSVGTDGLWGKSTVESKYIFDGFHNDNGHKLVMIRVEAEAITNA
uniref:Uncharacterized protein n=1 Tax=Siphoviridae sp. ctZd434 TaxID=2825559 RepID=A0A8S5UHQ6_9CAUD|nr:MAG TPA: hypothetical protein [Siphoviridae sp. ctZd434]